MRHAKLLLAVIAVLSLYACEAVENPRPNLDIDDDIFVDISVEGPFDFTFALYQLGGGSFETPRIAADNLASGVNRPSGTSLLVYLAGRLAEPGTMNCATGTPLPDFPDYPGVMPVGNLYLEFITDEAGTEECFLPEAVIRNLVRPGSYELGLEPGQVTFYMTGPFDVNSQEIAIYHREGGTLTISDVDPVSADVIGVPGIYFNYRIEGATATSPQDGETYIVTESTGRLFAQFPD